ncbi:MAG TPA: superoxide dismutase family protein [Chitinophagaceae bacterium]|nr:superoxide dismutase family protein [Chitinophagaceae bacterium]
MRSNSFSPKFLLSAGLLASVALFSCNSNKEEDASTSTAATTETAMPTPTTDSVPVVNHAEAKLSGTYPDTTVDGTVKFDTDQDGKVVMTLDLTVPSKAGKSIAVHIHEHGNCGDGGKLAHDHWNPTNAQHGKWGSASFHAGDIGNIQLDTKGKGTMSLATDLWTLGGQPAKNILGKAIIVHGGTDDYQTQPTGNAGTRIGCGVIQ